MSTDPLADWTLERDKWGQHERPHSLDSPGIYWHGSLADDEADQFERAKAITAAWAERGDEAQRFTVAPVNHQQANLYLDGEFYASVVRTGDLDAFVAQLNRPAPPADDLPEGVSWALVADGSVVRGLPDGLWERMVKEVWAQRGNNNAVAGQTYIVRRRPTPSPPAVERVPWWEALRDRRQIVVVNFSPSPAKSAEHRGGQITTEAGWSCVTDADGTVEVLRQDGAE